MARTITLRLSEEAYAAVQRYAAAERTSVAAWVEAVLDAEDTRRRCAAHDAWLEANPSISKAALEFASANHQSLAADGLPNLANGE